MPIAVPAQQQATSASPTTLCTSNALAKEWTCARDAQLRGRQGGEDRRRPLARPRPTARCARRSGLPNACCHQAFGLTPPAPFICAVWIRVKVGEGCWAELQVDSAALTPGGAGAAGSGSRWGCRQQGARCALVQPQWKAVMLSPPDSFCYDLCLGLLLTSTVLRATAAAAGAPRWRAHSTRLALLQARCSRRKRRLPDCSLLIVTHTPRAAPLNKMLRLFSALVLVVACVQASPRPATHWRSQSGSSRAAVVAWRQPAVPLTAALPALHACRLAA